MERCSAVRPSRRTCRELGTSACRAGPFGSFGSDSSLPTIASLALVFGGLILLSRVWFGFLRHLNGHHGFPVKRVVLVVTIWAVPLLLAPPLFSRDVYTYSAQGEMMSHHINPYSYGPEVLGATSFNQTADTVWSGTESPYGPTFLSADGLLDQASGHQILPDLVLLRLLEVAGIAMVIAATPTLARALKHDPAHAVLIGAGSPLVLLSLIGGAHNDALMVGLLMAGLAVAKRFGTVPGIMLCALGAGVKSPALLGVLFLGWVWAGREAPVRRRIGHTAVAGLIALATMELVSLVSGTGWGWIRTTSTADASFTGVTPINVVARAVSIVEPRVPGSDLDPHGAARLQRARSAHRRLLRLSDAPPLATRRRRPLPRPHPLGARPPGSDRVGLVRDVGRDRRRACSRRPRAECRRS